MSKNKYLFPLILVTSLFFLWAFLHNINSILIPHLKKALELTDTQSSYIDVAVYTAYFVIAIPAGLFVHKYSYKKGIILGLVLFATGAFLFIPAANSQSYLFFLVAIFISASGATFLETVANPYVSILGDKETATQRLNFAQSFNGAGALLAPIIGGQLILSGIEHTPAELKSMSATQLAAYLQTEADTVKLPYMVIGVVVIILILLFVFTTIPAVKEDDAAVEGHAPGANFSLRVFKNNHLKWAVLAEFCYVGAQVSVGSFFVRYAKFVADVGEKDAASMFGYIAMGGFMVGRFAGTFIMKYIEPAKLLSLYATINIVLLIAALTTTGNVALYSLMAVPFFMSIMFPTIFALGIKGLGEETKIASSFLVMSIIGGAVAPVFMGLISDRTGSIQTAYVVPMVCFLVILYFGLKGHRIIKKAI